MATSTFYKNIVIDDAAADVLIALLDKPVPPLPDISGKFRMATDEDDEMFLRNYNKRLSERKNQSNKN